MEPVSIDLPGIRSSLKRALFSSIIRLDESSIGKLFDLMIMMVKYQLSAATGPRELLLITLNHIDVMRDALINSSSQHALVLVHRMLIQLYGNFTYDQMWKMRDACLDQLNGYNVRVSILLRLGLQNENGSFNPSIIRNYDERYVEREISDLSKLTLLENSCQVCNVGSFELIGERVTKLGCNMYSSSCGINEKPWNKPDDGSRNTRESTTSLKGEPGSRAELGMLAIQLGRDEDTDVALSTDSAGRINPIGSFTLRLFNEIDEDPLTRSLSAGRARTKVECNRSSSPTTSVIAHDESTEPSLNDRHRAKLDEIYVNLFADEVEETHFSRKTELLELMDQLE